MPQNPLPKLAIKRSQAERAAPFEIKSAFEGDLLERQRLGVRLTEYVERLSDGAVIAIDGQWGDGKSWFGRHWAKTLHDGGHKVVFLDAFEQDYVEDPFLLIAGEIAKLIESEGAEAKNFRAKAAGVMTTLLPIATRAVVNAAGKFAFGTANFSEDWKTIVEASSEDLDEAAEKWVELKLKNYDAEKTSLKKFRDEIERFATQQEKPVIFFVDELDRCRPSFAIRLLERIKHFFDVPNVVFVLLLNKAQLEKAVQGMYGEGIDSSAYLSKFVHLFLRLPRPKPTNHGRSSHLNKYITRLFEQHGMMPSTQSSTLFTDCLVSLAIDLNLSLRDLEKAVPLYILSDRVAPGSAAFMIALRLRHQVIYEGLARADAQVRLKAAELLGAIRSKYLDNAEGWPSNYYRLLSMAVTGEGGTNQDLPMMRELIMRSYGLGIEEAYIFSIVAERLDLMMPD